MDWKLCFYLEIYCVKYKFHFIDKMYMASFCLEYRHLSLANDEDIRKMLSLWSLLGYGVCFCFTLVNDLPSVWDLEACSFRVHLSRLCCLLRLLISLFCFRSVHRVELFVLA